MDLTLCGAHLLCIELPGPGLHRSHRCAVVHVQGCLAGLRAAPVPCQHCKVPQRLHACAAPEEAEQHAVPLQLVLLALHLSLHGG